MSVIHPPNDDGRRDVFYLKVYIGSIGPKVSPVDYRSEDGKKTGKAKNCGEAATALVGHWRLKGGN